MSVALTPAQWTRLEELFQEAVLLPEEEQSAWVTANCAKDEDVATELLSLLHASGQTLAGLLVPAKDAAQHLLDDDNTFARIGPYRLVRVLGEGGMGVVYLARRDDSQYEQQVAIKLLHASLSHSPEMHLRIRTERQILATLNHANIALLLDGGITQAGVPYLVMEFVEGIPIDRFCRLKQVPLAGRLDLFSVLCGAVEYAHRNLVIHRDIKAANILVTESGIPKLLDFGIAKLTDTSVLPQAPATTRAHERLMTPEYASPEQLRGEAVTTATDVYALGVLLYELLTGMHPWPRDSADPVALLTGICSGPPRRPSTVRMQIENGKVTGPPPTDARLLRGDLDNIVLKAMRPEPEQRYANAALMLQDLQRYRAGLPVAASGDRLQYVLGKFVRRHRLGVALTAIMLLIIVSFAIAMAALARRATRNQVKAEREAQFLAGIFQAATPEGSSGKTVTARELLDQAATRLGTEQDIEPDMRADMEENIGAAYTALGLYDKAQPLLQQAADTTGKLTGGRSAEYAADLDALGTNLRLNANYARAEPLFRQALSLHGREDGARSLPVILDLSRLGDCLYWEDKDAEAEQVLRRSMAMEATLHAPPDASTRNYLALVLERHGQYPEAAHLLRDAVQISRASNGENSSSYAVSLHNFGSAQIDMGDLYGAEKTERADLALRRRVWGDHHPELIYPLNNLGYILLEEGNWQAAEPVLRETRELAEKVLPPSSIARTAITINEGRALEAGGQYEEAAKIYRAQAAVLSQQKASSSWTGAKLMMAEAWLALDTANGAEGVRLSQQAVQMEQMLSAGTNPALADALYLLGTAQLLQQDGPVAVASLQHALAIRLAVFPSTQPLVMMTQIRLAEALRAAGRTAEAQTLARAAVRTAHHPVFPLPGWQVAEADWAYAASHALQKQTGNILPPDAAIAASLRNYPEAAMRRYFFQPATPSPTQ